MTGATRHNVLVVDDDPAVVEYLSEALGDEGYAIMGTSSPMEAERLACEGAFELVIADIEMPEMRGVELVERIHRRRPDQLVLLITAFGSIDLASKALRNGACDFVAKPFTIEVLTEAIERSLRDRKHRREVVRIVRDRSDREGELVAVSPAMRKVRELAGRVARNEARVLLTGDSGVGKGAVAAYIHHASGRKKWIHMNCAALPSQLAEAELFGVRRGAFTDAREDRHGLFVEADGGTLLLDEIGELALEVQAKLLNVLETGRVRPVGSSTDVAVSTRVISATNRPLEDAVRAGRFRPDLFHRLNVIRIHVPTLRERKEDIPALIDVLLPRISRRVIGRELAIAQAAMRKLEAHHWPGNVRELANTLERAVALSEHDCVLLEDIDLEAPATQEHGDLGVAARRGMPLADVESAYVRKVVETAGGNKAKAARILGIDRRTLYRKLGESEPNE